MWGVSVGLPPTALPDRRESAGLSKCCRDRGQDLCPNGAQSVPKARLTKTGGHAGFYVGLFVGSTNETSAIVGSLIYLDAGGSKP